MAAMDDVGDLPLVEQLQRLDEVQQVLSAVLQNAPEIPQAGIPGLVRS